MVLGDMAVRRRQDGKAHRRPRQRPPLPLPQGVGAARGVLRVARMAVRERHVDTSPERFRGASLALLAEHTPP